MKALITFAVLALAACASGVTGVPPSPTSAGVAEPNATDNVSSQASPANATAQTTVGVTTTTGAQTTTTQTGSSRGSNVESSDRVAAPPRGGGAGEHGGMPKTGTPAPINTGDPCGTCR